MSLLLYCVSVSLACGGLFCDSTTPTTQPVTPGERRVDQTKEQIVFAVDEAAHKTEMHVQISYAGTASTFAWLVPVPEVPELFRSTDLLFRALDAPTTPVWMWGYSCVCCDSDAADNDGGRGAQGVTVAAQRQVGPYETVVLQGSSSEVVVEWLQENGYAIPDQVGDALDPYVARESWFVALRLQKDRDIGDLEPLGMSWSGTQPTVPLLLTRLAAVPDLQLNIWLFGPSRAVPENYLHVVPNPFAMPWAGSTLSTREVIARAADEAGGQAFVTDYAQPIRQALLPRPGALFDERALRGAGSEEELMAMVLQQGFPQDTRLFNLLRPFIPDIDAIAALLGTGPSATIVWDSGFTFEPDPSFNATPAVDALAEAYIEPAARAAALYQRHAWLTRLSSAMSPLEMTLDRSSPSTRICRRRRTCTSTGGSTSASRRRMRAGTWRLTASWSTSPRRTSSRSGASPCATS